MTDYFERVPEVLEAAVDHDLVLLPPALRNYLAVDSIGRRIWELLAQRQDVARLCRTLASEYDAPADQIAADVMAFLEELLEEGAIVRGEAP